MRSCCCGSARLRNRPTPPIRQSVENTSAFCGTERSFVHPRLPYHFERSEPFPSISWIGFAALHITGQAWMEARSGGYTPLPSLDTFSYQYACPNAQYV